MTELDQIKKDLRADIEAAEIDITEYLLEQINKLYWKYGNLSHVGIRCTSNSRYIGDQDLPEGGVKHCPYGQSCRIKVVI